MKVLLFFGGPSEERDVSAGSIKPWVTYLQADPASEVSVVFIDRDLQPYLLPPLYYYANTCADFESQLRDADGGLTWDEVADLARAHDVAVPIVHGSFGEDGVLQQRFEAWGVPYVFSTPDALARTLDKERCYDTLAQSGFAVPGYLRIERSAWEADPTAAVTAALGLEGRLGPVAPGDKVAVKPVAGGSSFGVSVVPLEPAAVAAAVDAAMAGGATAALVEEFVPGIEFSVVVLDGPGGSPCALAPTEVDKPHGSLVYGTEEKYLHGSGVLHHTPMRIDDATLHEIRRRATQAYGALGLRHMARIDGFLTPEGVIVVTDINGIGGMGFSSFVFQQAAMIGLDHRGLIFGLLAAATGGDGVVGATDAQGPPSGRRIHVILGGTTSERQVSRQSGCFVGLSLLASGYDVRFTLMDLRSRYTEIGLFYVLHHDVEEIQSLVDDPLRRAAVERVGARVRAEFGLSETDQPTTLAAGHPLALAESVAEADMVFLALHGGPGEDGRLQLALDHLGVPYNGSGPRASQVASDKAVTAGVAVALGIDGVGAPTQRVVSLFELGSWAGEAADTAGAERIFAALCTELGGSRLVCKPATDGCSTGVKILKDPATMARFFTAVVREDPEFASDEVRTDLGDRAAAIAMPVPPPTRWLLERAFVEDEPVALPRGDLNLETLRPWFEAKRYVELTAAVLDRPGRGLVAAVPSVAVAADELTLQQKFQQGVGTNLALDLFVGAARAESVRARVEAIARGFEIEGYARLDLFWDQVDDIVHLLEINTLCGLTEATVFYSQWLADDDPLPPWAALDRIVEAAVERSAGR